MCLCVSVPLCSPLSCGELYDTGTLSAAAGGMYERIDAYVGWPVWFRLVRTLLAWPGGEMEGPHQLLTLPVQNLFFSYICFNVESLILLKYVVAWCVCVCVCVTFIYIYILKSCLLWAVEPECCLLHVHFFLFWKNKTVWRLKGTTSVISFCQQQAGHTLQEAVDDYDARSAKAIIDYSYVMMTMMIVMTSSIPSQCVWYHHQSPLEPVASTIARQFLPMHSWRAQCVRTLLSFNDAVGTLLLFNDVVGTLLLFNDVVGMLLLFNDVVGTLLCFNDVVGTLVSFHDVVGMA